MSDRSPEPIGSPSCGALPILNRMAGNSFSEAKTDASRRTTTESSCSYEPLLASSPNMFRSVCGSLVANPRESTAKNSRFSSLRAARRDSSVAFCLMRSSSSLGSCEEKKTHAFLYRGFFAAKSFSRRETDPGVGEMK